VFLFPFASVDTVVINDVEMLSVSGWVERLIGCRWVCGQVEWWMIVIV
jgi:hypothetical protein